MASAAVSRRYRSAGREIVTISSASVGWRATVASRSALRAPIFSGMAMSCASSAALGPTMWQPSTRSVAPSTTKGAPAARYRVIQSYSKGGTISRKAAREAVLAVKRAGGTASGGTPASP